VKLVGARTPQGARRDGGGRREGGDQTSDVARAGPKAPPRKRVRRPVMCRGARKPREGSIVRCEGPSGPRDGAGVLRWASVGSESARRAPSGAIRLGPSDQARARRASKRRTGRGGIHDRPTQVGSVSSKRRAIPREGWAGAARRPYRVAVTPHAFGGPRRCWPIPSSGFVDPHLRASPGQVVQRGGVESGPRE
jgi:hypothetical protein